MYTEYDGLSSTERICYQKLLEQIESFQTEFKLYATPANTIAKAYHAVIADHPEFFWLTGAGEYSATTLGGVIQDVTFYPELTPGTRMSSVPAMAGELELAVSGAVARARRYRDPFQQALTVHDYIIDTTRYDMGNPGRYNAYGCLVQNRAVCAGYAKAFMLIMKRLGYVCGYAAGWDAATGGTHGWNYIQLDGQFYFIDVTWDDPTTSNAAYGTDNKTRNYFCVTTEELQITHRLSNEYRVPYCGGTKYNYYNYNGMTLSRYSFDAVAQIASPQLRAGNAFTVKFTSRAEADRAFRDLIENRKVYTIPGMGRSILYSRSKNGLILSVENN